jgi:hypothetical protein
VTRVDVFVASISGLKRRKPFLFQFQGRDMSSPPEFPVSNQSQRDELLAWIRQTPLVTGPWRGFKKLFKDAESAFVQGERDAQILAALLARLDAQPHEPTNSDNGVLLGGNFAALHVEGTVLYAATNQGAIETYDFADLLAPRLVSSVKVKDDAFYSARFQRDGAYLWLQSNSDFWAFDVENPTEPRMLGYLDARATPCAVAGDLVVAFGRPNLRVWSFQNGAFSEVGRSGA